MNILKYKYKAHKLVNTLFYIVVFGIGFILGFGAEKLDFNKLLSQVLMIDNVKAYNITSTIDEDYIVEKFSQHEDFDITIYKNIFCLYSTRFTSDQYCYAFTDDALSKTTFSYSTSREIDIRLRKEYISNITPSPAMMLNLYDNTVKKMSDYSSDIWITQKYSSYKNLWYFGFIPDGFNESSWFGTRHLLDFSKYSVKLEYNENLFKDNPDFKEVCVNNYDTFSITSNEISSYGDDGSPQFHDFDFIWFQNGLAYLSAFQYDSESSTHINFYDDIENEFVGWGYWLDTKEEIDKHFSSSNPGTYLAFKGYEDKYSYYNWTLYPFEMTFTKDYYFYTIFSFNNSYLKQAGISTKVDNAYIKYLDGTIKEDSEQYCFYIKNEYDVNILNRNENGDFNSTITILGGINKDDATYEMEMGRNTKGFFSTVNNFISKIRPTIVFINTHIFELYSSMPLIVRSFIISFLVLILIRILIGMVVR